MECALKNLTAFLILLTVSAASPVWGEAPENPKSSHGVFTGAIKSVIYVSDVEKSAPFYRDVLGFGFEGFANSKGQPYYAEMSAAGIKFGLHEPMSEQQQTKKGQQRLYFRLMNLAPHFSRVKAWGGNPGEKRETPWMDMFIVRDPDGNEIVFAVTDPQRHSINPWNTHPEPIRKDEPSSRGKN